jgi:hypothetical protein
VDFNEKLRSVPIENNENERNDNENMAALQSSLPSKHENTMAFIAGSKDKAIQSKCKCTCMPCIITNTGPYALQNGGET